MVADETSKTGLRPLIVRSQVCVAAGAWSAYQGMSDWCQLNCLRYPPHCPQTMCTCLTTCKAADNARDERDQPLTDFECSKRCLRYPHNDQCPRQCKCSSDPGEDLSSFDAVVIDARGQSRVDPRPARPTLIQPNLYSIPMSPLVPLYWQYLPLLNTNHI